MMDIDGWAERLFAARKAGRPKPCCSGELEGVDEAVAYRVQAEFVRKMILQSPISGFKGALTNKASQASMGMDTPTSGVLLKEMQLSGETAVKKSQFNLPIVETEVGLVISKDISSKLALSDLADYVAYYQPMVEVADAASEDPSTATVYDFIAGNSAAAGYIEGDKSNIRNVNSVVVRLFKDGELLHEGNGADTMGDQDKAAVWLINHVIDQGYTIEKGHVLMTGSLGRIRMVTDPGHFIADFGNFGKVEFDIQ
jgi:2-keto-4-pentenoate hydratase